MQPTTRISRRSALKLGAAASALPLVHIRTAGAAGRLSVAFWDHWVPVGNEVIRKQVEAWADQSKVNVQLDFITSVGFKNRLTLAAEAQARTGHDLQTFSGWFVTQYTDQLEPMDDVMGRLTGQHGPANAVFEYLGVQNGRWTAVPTSVGTQNKGPCGRISVLKEKAGLDIVEMYPATDQRTPAAAGWTWEAHLKAAAACQKAGMPFGIGLGQTADSVDTAGALFSAYGAELVDAKGQIAIKSDAVRQVLEHAQRLAEVLPADAVSYDDASNNRALISGKSALIWNPPSAWAVAKRDAPHISADCWTFAAPAGPKGRFMPHSPQFWGVWSFAQNKPAAKALIEHLMQRDLVRERCTAVDGYDLPPFASMTEFPVWAEVGPPRGTVYNYPVRSWHDAQVSIAGFPAPPSIAVQMYNRATMPAMFAKLHSGQPANQVIAWAEAELEGFMR